MRTFDELSARVKVLENERVNYDNVRQEIADHEFGERDFQIHRSPAEVRTRLIYDATALFSWKILSAGVFNFLANPDTQFFDLATEDPRLLDRGPVRQWVEETQETLWKLIVRPSSGFTTAMQEFFGDLTGFGMGAVFVEDVPGGPLRFSARPLPEIYVAENAAGQIDTVFRKFQLTHRQAIQRFGKERLPVIRGKLERAPEQKSDFWHGVHRANDPLYRREIGAPWRGVFFSMEEKGIVQDRPMRRQPYKVARWDRRAGEVYGFGPGHIALPEQRMLNAMRKTVIENAQLKARPPIAVADDDVINPLNLNPEGQNVVRAAGFSTDPIRLLETTGDTGLAVEMLQQQQAKVRGAFLHDLLEILQGPINTATQVIEMVQKARSLLAPTISRLQVEALEPLIDDSFLVAFDAGAFAPPPPELRGTNLKVVYRNPVARSQQESEARAIDDFAGFVLNLSEVRPEVLDKVDWDVLVDERHRAKGVPQRVLRTQREVDRDRAQRARLAAQAQQEQQVQQAAESLGKVAPALREAREVQRAAA